MSDFLNPSAELAVRKPPLVTYATTPRSPTRKDAHLIALT